jgi:hypothetical protein
VGALEVSGQSVVATAERDRWIERIDCCIRLIGRRSAAVRPQDVCPAPLVRPEERLTSPQLSNFIMLSKRRKLSARVDLVHR